jgi:Uma2 family endonuclease
MDDVTDQLLIRIVELEAEYKALSMLHEKATERTVQLTEKVAELEAWQMERIEQNRGMAAAYGDVIRSRHELAAVIEEAKAAAKRGNMLTPDWVIEVLETADTAAVLAERDRRIEEAWLARLNRIRMAVNLLGDDEITGSAMRWLDTMLDTIVNELEES